MTAEEVAQAVRGYRFAYVKEDDLQEGLAAALAERFPDAVRREVALGGKLGRIDLTVDRVGVESKVDGPARKVRKQVERYCDSTELDAVVLVSSKAKHLKMPATVNGKPVIVVSLLGSRWS